MTRLRRLQPSQPSSLLMRYSAMDGTRVFHFCLRWTIRMAACVFILLMLLAVALLVIASHLRDPLIHFLSDSTNRHIQVSGRFEANLLSLHPHLTAERVV